MPNWVEPPLPDGDRLDHQVDVDAGLQPERHRLGGGGDVDRDQQIVDELDLGRGAERTEIEAKVGETLDHRLDLLGGFGIAAEIDHGLARRHHAGRAADLAVEIGRALLRKRRDVLLLVGHRMRAELDDDLAGPAE